MFKEKFSYEELYDIVNKFIDDKVDIDGIGETVKYLLRCGLTADQLLYLNFDADTIIEACGEISKEDGKK